MTALMDTALEIREDVQVLRRDVGRLRLDVDGLTRRMRVLQNDVARMNRAVLAIVAHLGITVAREDPDGDRED